MVWSNQASNTFVINPTTGPIKIYNGTPAAGNLIDAISPNAGVDEFGNHYAAGLSVLNDPPGAGNGQISFFNNPQVNNVSSFIAGYIDGGGNPRLDLDAAGGIVGVDSGSKFVVGGIANGAPGKYYEEKVALNSQVITGATNTALTNFTKISTFAYNDYGVSAWNLVTGTWTCPEDSIYHWTWTIKLTGVSTSSIIMSLCRNGAAIKFGFLNAVHPVSSINLFAVISGSDEFSLNDTVKANINVDSTATIVGGSANAEVSKIVVRRYL